MPGHQNLKMAEREGEHFNLTDYENWLVARYDSSRNGVPQGTERLTGPRWVSHVLEDLPKSEWTFSQYEAHVKAGFGDEWFQNQDRPPGEEWGEAERPPAKNGAE